jgi:hypothetical protein
LQQVLRDPLHGGDRGRGGGSSGTSAVHEQTGQQVLRLKFSANKALHRTSR